MAEPALTRREFVRTGAAAAAGAALALQGAARVAVGNPAKLDTSKVLNYSPDMEYRRCGKTNLMVSAVCLGGHWKRANEVVPGLFEGGNWLGANLDNPEFEKNRAAVVTRAIERGVNYIDACTREEVIMYSKALKGRRDKMYLGFSWYQEEMRGLGSEWQQARKQGKPKPPGWITQKLKEAIDHGFKATGLEYVDLWRVTCHEGSSAHDDAEIEELVAALDWAKKTGRAHFTGISSHDRPHIKKLIEKYPHQMEVIVTPFTAKTKVEATEDKVGLWAAMKKMDVGWFGIKPYASGSLFDGKGIAGDPNLKADNRKARLAIRAILCNSQITAPIPGMICPDQVDNVALAVKERRELDAAERAELDEAMDRAWAKLPYHYRWLKDWEYV